MKKLIVCFVLAAFAALPVVAGEKCCKEKAKVVAEAAADKAACADKDKAASACTKTPSKQTVLSPKAAASKKS